jgi:short chain dehydrogenase
MLPGDPVAAASAFAAGFDALAELAGVSGGSGVVAAFADLLSSRDGELLQDQRYASAFEETMHEALRQGTRGAGWDNVSWIGRWDIDLSAIRCPVRLWYGSDDPLAAPAHGEWLSENLPQARLVLRDGEGHLGIYEHLGEMLDALTEPEAAGPPGTVRPQLRGAAADIRYPAIEADSDYPSALPGTPGGRPTLAFLVTKTALPAMTSRGWGRIIMVASLTGPVMAIRADVGYVTAKAGMVGLTRAAAVDAAGHGPSMPSPQAGFG